MIDGRKYITNPKPKNGKKIKVEIIGCLPLTSLALSPCQANMGSRIEPHSQIYE
jgi:hypothetical protein